MINNCVTCCDQVHNVPDRTAGEIIEIKVSNLLFGGRRRSLAGVTSMAVIQERDEIIRTHHTTMIWLLNSNHLVASLLVFVRMLNARGLSINPHYL